VNYPYILLSSLIILFIFLLIFVPFAGGYSLDITPEKLNDKPIVCFYDTPKDFKWASYKAMHIWNNALEKYDYPDRIKYRHIPLEYNAENFVNECNIQIRFVDVVIWGGKNTTFWGLTPCHPVFCSIQISTTDRTIGQKVRTIAHEIGHALSLGHVRSQEPQEALALPCSNNVMWEFPCTKSLPSVNLLILMALECAHAEDGFGGNYNEHCKKLVFGKDII